MTITTSESTTATVPAQGGEVRLDWTRVCQVADLQPECGAAALVDGTQVALFRLADGTVLATENRDPKSGANVMSRGIVGSRGAVPTVASPMLKQVFDLRDGTCLDDASLRLGVYPVRVSNGFVEVALPVADVPGSPDPVLAVA